jgi:hypothetical protein
MVNQKNFQPKLKQLLLLLNGDKTAAHRLIDRSAECHPGRSAEWHLDKVIFDLERDRGR